MPDLKHPALPYVLPMVGFLSLTALEGVLPQSGGGPDLFWYPLTYTVKIAIVAVLVWECRASWLDLRPRPSAAVLGLSVVLGLAVAALWVGLDGHYPEIAFLGKRTGFNPHSLSPAICWGFVAVRMIGLVLMVPLIEELFWRSFLMRWVIDPNWTKVPVGRVTPLAAVTTAALFGFAHPEWLPGILTGLAWAWLVGKTKSVAACVVSHMVANLALGLYVLASGDWKFW